MRIKLLLLGLFVSLGIQAQQLDPQRTGKDSIAIETSMVVMTEKFTTAEIYAFSRTTANKPAYVFNSDTETLWAWTGTEWKDLGLAPVSGGITIDPTIQNGSTNPVENNAVYDRLLQVVDEAADSPSNQIELWLGTKAEYATADKTNPDRVFIVTDSVYDPSPSGSGIDGYISNVEVVGNALNFTGQGGAFNQSVTLPSSGGGSTQTISQSFNNTNYDLTTSISEANTVVTPLDELYQDASEVEYDDTNSMFSANDVQEVIDEMFGEGTGTTTVTLVGGVGNTIVTNIGICNYEWKRFGKTVFLQGYFEADYSSATGAERTAGAQFLISMPNADLPAYFSPLGRAPLTEVHFGPTSNFLAYSNTDTFSYIRDGASPNDTNLYLNWAIDGIPSFAAFSATGVTFAFNAVYTIENP